jgi:molybdate transport system substrate-binding protein
MRIAQTVVALLLAASWAFPSRAEEAVRIYAAASLTNALTEVADAWQRAGHPKPTLVFAGSPTLAKQVESGAPADILASADQTWMDYLAQRGKVDRAFRVDLLGNELVLITPRGRGFSLKLEKGFDLAGAFEGRLCTGDPEVVPAGIYAKQALTTYGWWSALSSRIVGTDDVRTALAFVQRGECALGIVYATDAAIGGDKVQIVGRFPAESHDPVVYPFAIVPGAGPQAPAFFAYLRSDAAQQVFRKHGFTIGSPGRSARGTDP